MNFIYGPSFLRGAIFYFCNAVWWRLSWVSKINMQFYLDGIKVSLYLSAMKNIKVSPKVHTELKTFVASRPEWDMSLFASQAILKLLRESGHKFIFPTKKQLSKTKK